MICPLISPWIHQAKAVSIVTCQNNCMASRSTSCCVAPWIELGSCTDSSTVFAIELFELIPLSSCQIECDNHWPIFTNGLHSTVSINRSTLQTILWTNFFQNFFGGLSVFAIFSDQSVSLIKEFWIATISSYDAFNGEMHNGSRGICVTGLIFPSCFFAQKSSFVSLM